MKKDGGEKVHIILSRQSAASDFGTPQSHAFKDESGVISKDWCVRGTLSPGLIN